MWRVTAPVRVPSQRPLAPIVTSNDIGNNEVIPGAVHRSPGIYLRAEKTFRKTSARRQSDEGAVRTVIASNASVSSK